MADTMALKDFTFGLTDYIVFAIMLSASTSVGIYFGVFAKAKNTPDEYLMGGRKMKTIPIAISLVASQLSSISIMAVPGEIYTFGTSHFFLTLAVLLVAPIIAYIITPVFYENHFNNCYEYLERRFNKFSRQLVTVSFILNAILLIPAYMFVPSLAFAQVSGLNVHLINTGVCLVCIFYTMLGGIKAVVWSDVIQAGIMLGSVILVATMGIVKTGGLDKVIEYGSEGGRLDVYTSWDVRTRYTVWNGLAAGLIYWTGHVGLNQSCVQRIVSLPSLKHAKKSLWLTGVGIFTIMTFNCFTGVIIYAYYKNCDPIRAGHVEKADKLVPFFVQDIIGHLKGIPGVFISCVFSASLSTLSANFNSLAGIIYFDYIRPFVRHTDAKANFIMKIVVLILGFYCIAGGFVVEQFSSILQMLITFTGISTGAVVGMFLLGIFVPRINGKVALTAFAISSLSMIWIICNAQLRQQSGQLKYVPLPTNIDNCEARNIEIIEGKFNTTVFPTKRPVTYLKDEEFSIYDISFHWYKVLGATIYCTVAFALSFIWKTDKSVKHDLKLYSPLVRKLIRDDSMEMK